MEAPRFQKKVNDLANDEKYVATAQAFVELLMEEKLPLYKEKAKEYKALSASLASVAPGPAGPAPTAVITAMDDLRAESEKFVTGLNALRMLIITKTPEIKEEDNAGVAIQNAFAELVDSYIDTLTGVGNGKKDGAGISLVSMSAKKDYLSARASAEEKVHKASCPCGATCKCGMSGDDDKDKKGDCGCNISKETPSTPQVLVQVDTDAAYKIAIGFTKLHQAGMQLVVGVSRNIAKLLTPRRSGSHMIG